MKLKNLMVGLLALSFALVTACGGSQPAADEAPVEQEIAEPVVQDEPVEEEVVEEEVVEEEALEDEEASADAEDAREDAE